MAYSAEHEVEGRPPSKSLDCGAPSQKKAKIDGEHTEIQQALWPDSMPTDPGVVSTIYNNKATTYAADIMKDGWRATFDQLAQEIDRALAEGAKTVLDAGCGSGLLGEQYEFPPGIALHGVDISAACLSIAKLGGNYASLQEANLEKTLPFSTDTFDLVVCNGVLGYCATNDPLSELARVLKPGCRMLLNFRHKQFLERRCREALAERGCTLLREALFDPFPENDAYTHDYIHAVIQKT